jgi:hypothetical protein
MRNHKIALVWLGGLVIALALYLAGPDQFIATVLDAADAVEFAVERLVGELRGQIYSLVRSLAIALLIVFIVLALAAARRGLRARVALVVVGLLFLALVWRPEPGMRPAPPANWLGALALVAVGAIVMTRRLASAPGSDLHRPGGN